MEAVAFLQFGLLLGLALAIGFLLVVCISRTHGLRNPRGGRANGRVEGASARKTRVLPLTPQPQVYPQSTKSTAGQKSELDEWPKRERSGRPLGPAGT